MPVLTSGKCVTRCCTHYVFNVTYISICFLCVCVLIGPLHFCAVTEKYYESDSTDASSDDEAPSSLSSPTNPLTAVTEQPVSTGSEEKESKKATKKGRSTVGTKQKSLTSFFKKP